jgi:hypothetical protein
VAATNGSCGTCPALTWSFLLPILLTPAHNYVCVGGGDAGKDDDTIIANKFQVRVDHRGGSEERSTDVVNHLP